MKIIFKIFIVTLILFSIVTSSNVAGAVNNTNKDIAVQVVVNSIFQLTLNRHTIDFEKLNPGENSSVETVSMNGLSNNPSRFIINNKAEDLSSGKNTIAIENLVYEVTKTAGDGTVVSGIIKLKNIDKRICRSLNNPTKTKEITVDVDYTLAVPKDSMQGEYTTTIIVTMTE